jgi:hypothetical protein
MSYNYRDQLFEAQFTPLPLTWIKYKPKFLSDTALYVLSDLMFWSDTSDSCIKRTHKYYFAKFGFSENQYNHAMAQLVKAGLISKEVKKLKSNDSWVNFTIITNIDVQKISETFKPAENQTLTDQDLNFQTLNNQVLINQAQIDRKDTIVIKECKRDKSLSHSKKVNKKIAKVRDFDLSGYTDEEVLVIEEWIDFRNRNYNCKKSHQAIKVQLNHILQAKLAGRNILRMLKYFMERTTYQNVNPTTIELALKQIQAEQRAANAN